jgi:hypothetical protein
VTCTLPSLGVQSSAPAIAIVATAPSTAGNITSTATVHSATADPVAGNNTATTVTLASAFADLRVAVTDNLDPIQGPAAADCSSGCVTYTIAVDNAGPDPAAGVQVVTQLPPNGFFYEAFGTGWICPAPSGILTCTRTSLAAGTALPITLVWKAPSPGGFSIVVTSMVSATSTDRVLDNNAATQDTFVQP